MKKVVDLLKIIYQDDKRKIQQTWKIEGGHTPTLTALSKIICSALLSLGYQETIAEIGVNDETRTCCGAISASINKF